MPFSHFVGSLAIREFLVSRGKLSRSRGLSEVGLLLGLFVLRQVKKKDRFSSAGISYVKGTGSQKTITFFSGRWLMVFALFFVRIRRKRFSLPSTFYLPTTECNASEIVT